MAQKDGNVSAPHRQLSQALSVMGLAPALQIVFH
jgi:hypothetical protein